MSTALIVLALKNGTQLVARRLTALTIAAPLMIAVHSPSGVIVRLLPGVGVALVVCLAIRHVVADGVITARRYRLLPSLLSASPATPTWQPL